MFFDDLELIDEVDTFDVTLDYGHRATCGSILMRLFCIHVPREDDYAPTYYLDETPILEYRTDPARTVTRLAVEEYCAEKAAKQKKAAKLRAKAVKPSVGRKLLNFLEDKWSRRPTLKTTSRSIGRRLVHSIDERWAKRPAFLKSRSTSSTTVTELEDICRPMSRQASSKTVMGTTVFPDASIQCQMPGMVMD